MNASVNKSTALKWFEAFNTQNLNLLLSLYDENARHYSPKLKARKPETGGYIQGREMLGSWWADAFKRIPSLRYEVTNLIVSEDAVFMEYIRHADGEPDLSVGEVLEIKNNLIVYSRVYHG